MTDKYPILYKCRICGKEFDYLDAIVEHVNKKEKIII